MCAFVQNPRVKRIVTSNPTQFPTYFSWVAGLPYYGLIRDYLLDTELPTTRGDKPFTTPADPHTTRATSSSLTEDTSNFDIWVWARAASPERPNFVLKSSAAPTELGPASLASH